MIRRFIKGLIQRPFKSGDNSLSLEGSIMSSTFDKYIKDSSKLLKDLYPVYKSNIEELYELKAQSKQYMNELSDIDAGLNKEILKKQEESLHKLLDSIRTYNQFIDNQVNQFYKTFNDLRTKLRAVVNHYESEKGELTSVLDLRRQMLFLMILFRKYKTGIHNLQLMNNALFSFSEEFKQVNEVYKTNLVKAATVVLEAEEQVQSILYEMEALN